VSTILGHADVRMTERYTHVLEQADYLKQSMQQAAGFKPPLPRPERRTLKAIVTPCQEGGSHA
jgi:hypothetical protein